MSEQAMDTVRDMTADGTVVIESQEKVLASAFAKAGIPFLLHRLTPSPAGDLAFMQHGRMVGGEVKEAKDLIASWSGPRMKCKPVCPYCAGRGCSRLDSQMYRMTANYDHVILFIHGWFGVNPRGYIVVDGRPTGRLWDGLWNALMKWQMRGVCIDMSTSRKHVMQRVQSMRAYIERRGWPALYENRS